MFNLIAVILFVILGLFNLLGGNLDHSVSNTQTALLFLILHKLETRREDDV